MYRRKIQGIKSKDNTDKNLSSSRSNPLNWNWIRKFFMAILTNSLCQNPPKIVSPLHRIEKCVLSRLVVARNKSWKICMIELKLTKLTFFYFSTYLCTFAFWYYYQRHRFYIYCSYPLKPEPLYFNRHLIYWKISLYVEIKVRYYLKKKSLELLIEHRFQCQVSAPGSFWIKERYKLSDMIDLDKNAWGQ